MATGTPVGNMIIKVDLDSVGLEHSMTGLQRQLKLSNKAMGAQLSAFDRGEKSSKKYGVMIEGLTNRHRIQAKIVEEAKAKYSRMAEQYGENSVKAQKAAQDLNKEIALYQETGRELDKVSAEFKQFQRTQGIQSKGWYKIADGMEKYGGKMQAVGKKMTGFGTQYSRKVTLPIVAGGAAMVKSATDYESAFAGVRKTVDMTEEGYEQLSTGIRNMAKELPASATSIAAVAESAGQLGIENKNILKFTRTVIDLGEATNLTADQASTEFARFANIVKMPQKNFDRLGSSIVALGNNMATTESEIMSMGMRLAAQGSQIGMTEAQIMALAGTMSSLGIEAEAGGTAMTTVLKKIDKAVGSGGKSLASFAETAGVSSKDFAKAWKDDPIVALEMFITGLDKSGKEGKNLTSILGELGIKGIRESDTILRMAGASDLLSEAVNISTRAWEENTALTNEAEQRYKTTESQLKILRNRIKDIGITLGGALIPALLDTIDAAEPLIKKIESGAQAFADMDESQQRTIIKLIALTAAIGPASIGVGQLSSKIGGVLKASGSLTKTLGGAGGSGTVKAISALSKAGVVGLAIAGVGALSVGIYGLVTASKNANKANLDSVESLNKQAVSLETSANTFDELSSKAKISNSELAKLNDLNKRISESSNPGEINELQKQYDALAKKSGLSKEELQRLFKANSDIIKQSPEVETSVSKQGNAFAKNTDSVRGYIDSLYEMSRVQLEAERVKQLKEEREIRKEITRLQQEEKQSNDQLQYFLSARNMTEEEIYARKKEVLKLSRSDNLSQEEKNQLTMEQRALYVALHGDIDEEIIKRQEVLQKQQKSTQEEQKKLDKLKALSEEMPNIILKQAGINEEGEKGLAKLDQTLAKNQQELTQLEEKKRRNEGLTQEEQKRYTKLTENNQKLTEAKQYLFEELGVYKDINSLADMKISKLSVEGQRRVENLAKTIDLKVEEGNIVKQIENKNTKLLEERTNLEENRKKQGANKKEIDKQISSIDAKIGKNDRVLVQILKEIGVWDEVKDSINLSSTKLDQKNKKIDSGTNKLNKQGSQIDSNNSKTDKGIKKEQQRTKEAGKDVDKNVNAKDNHTVDKINKKAGKGVNKDVNVKGKGISKLNKEASNPVTKVVHFIGKGLSKLKFWAKGTPPSGHPGGMAVVGDGGGRELIRTPQGKTFLSPSTDTIMNLPKGTHVIPHDQTERLLKSIPRYANGTDMLRDSEVMRLLAINGKDNDTEQFSNFSRRNSTSVVDTGDTYELHIHVQGELPNSTIRRMAEQFEKEIKRINDRKKMGKGEVVRF